VTLCAWWAHASPARVALVHDEKADPLQQRALTRLRAELAAGGFEVTEIVRAAGDARDAAEAVPPVANVFATIAILPRTADAADIWVSDRITGKTVVRRVQGNAGTDHDVATVLAVRAVELLQASLLEAVDRPTTDQRPLPEAQPMPTEVADWMQKQNRTSEPRFALRAGLGLLHSFGGVHAGVLPMLGASYRVAPAIALSLGLGAQAFASDVDAAPFGTIAVRQELACLDVVYQPLASRAPLRPITFLGAGAYHLDVVGTARAPYEGRSAGKSAAFVDFGLGAMLSVSPRVSLLAAARALFLLPKPVIRAAGDSVADVGRPSLLGEMAVEVRF
jgi:hypothetical protein